MADNNQPVFTELIELKVDLGSLKSSFAQAEKEYAEFIKRLGSGAKDALAGSGLNALGGKIDELRDDLRLFVTESATGIETLVKTFNKFFDTMDSTAGQALQKRASKNKAALAEQQKAVASAVAAEEQTLGRTLSALEKEAATKRAILALDKQREAVAINKGRSLSTDSEGQENAGLERNLKATDKLRSTIQQVQVAFDKLARTTSLKTLEDQIDEVDARIKNLRLSLAGVDKGGKFSNASPETLAGLSVTDQAGAERTLDLVKQLNAAEAEGIRLLVEHERVSKQIQAAGAGVDQTAQKRRDAVIKQDQEAQLAAAAREQATTKAQEANAQAREAIENAAAKRRAAILQKDLEARANAAKAERDGIKLARDIDTGIQGAKDRELADGEKKTTALNAALQKLTVTLEKVKAVGFGNNLPAQIDTVRNQLKALQAQADKLNIGGKFTDPSKRSTFTPEDLAGLKEFTGLQEQIASKQARFNSLTRQSETQLTKAAEAGKTFGDRVIGGFTGTLAHLIRFYVAMNAIQAVLGTIQLGFRSMFDLVAGGIRYTQELEKNTSSLAGVIASNAQFAGDLAENFKISRDAAKEVVALLQDKSIQSGLGRDALENTFKALLEGGGAKGTNNLRELVDLSVLFQKSLDAAGVGGLAAQGSIEEISKLFQQIPSQSNKFLALLHLTSEEWVKIRTEGEKHRDLLPRLYERVRPYLSALEIAKNDQAVLVQRIDLLKDRLSAIAGEQLFSKITDSLKKLIEFIDDNRDKVIAFIEVFTDSFLLMITQMERFSLAFSGSGFLGTLLTVRNLMFQLVASATLLAQIKLRGDFKAALDGFNSQLKDIEDSTKAIKALYEGTPLLPADLKDGQFNPGNNSLLDRPFKGTPPPAAPKPGIQNSLAKYEEEKRKYQANVEDVVEATKLAKDRVEDLAQSQTISQAEAARRLSSIIASETAAITELNTKFQSIISATKSAISGDRGTPDPNDRKKALESFNAQVIALQTDYKKKLFGINRESFTANRRVNAEQNALEKEDFSARIKRIQGEQEQEQALVSAARDVGLLTELEYLDSLEIIAKQSAETRRAAIDEEIKDKGEGTLRARQLNNERAKSDQDLANQLEIIAGKRSEFFIRDAAAMNEYARQLREIDASVAETFVRLGNQLRAEAGFNRSTDQLFNARIAELNLLEAQKLKLLEIARAKNAESEQTRRLVLDIKELEAARINTFSERLSSISSGSADIGTRNALSRNAINQEGLRLRAQAGQAQARLLFFDTFNNLNGGGSDPKQAAVRAQFVSDLEAATKAVSRFKTELEDRATPGVKRAVTGILDTFIGGGVRQSFAEARAAGDEMGQAAAAANAVGNALTVLTSVINSVKEGYKNGGIAGGIGAGITALGPALEAIPVVGKFLPAIGSILTFVGSMFTAAAKRIAESVKKSFENTLKNYQNGTATLIDTITELERARSSAISRLSGSKGGKAELDKILPGFDDEIASLRRKQKEILTAFEGSLDILRLQSDVLAGVNKQWVEINKQVKDYIGAGGDAAKAAEYLSISLAKLRKDAVDDLAQGEQEAIKEALRLNTLLEQRTKILDDFRKQEFELLNADAIERRQPGSVTRGRQLEELRKQRDEQLAQLDEEVRIATVRVSREREVFGLAVDVAALKRRDEELTIRALDAQIQKWVDLKAIVASITLGENGLFGAAAGFFRTPSAFEITVNVNGGVGDPYGVGQQIGEGILSELDRQNRLAPGF